MHVWVVLGDSEWIVRLPSAVFGAATAAVVFAIGVRLFNRRVATIATTLLIVNAVFLHHAQEARGYSLELLLVAIGWLALVVAVDSGSRRSLVVYALCMTLAAYVNLLAVLMILAQLTSLALLPRRQIPWRPLAMALVATGLSLTPLVMVAVRFQGGHLGWIPGLTAFQVAGALSSFAASDTGPSLVQIALFALYAVAWLGGAAIALATVRRHRLSLESWRYCLVVAWLAVPFLSLILISSLKPLLVPRYLVGSLPAATLLGAVAIARIRSALLRNAALGVLLLFSAIQVWGWYSRGADDWRSAAAFVLSHTEAGDGIGFVPSSDRVPFVYYLHRSSPTRAPEQVVRDSSWWPFGLTGQTARSPADEIGAVRSHQRFWLVLGTPARPSDADDPRYGTGYQGALKQEARDVENQVLTGYQLQGEQDFEGATVLLFERQPFGP